ncbi:helix-turn-helix domain-containing protein [Quadrisphaera granulorum]|uniref:helix-turn-helix transcriptional regulator n=1 Tax=Quadrisphaera granulorum TaxID=317664 RepID=UPI00319EB903
MEGPVPARNSSGSLAKIAPTGGRSKPGAPSHEAFELALPLHDLALSQTITALEPRTPRRPNRSRAATIARYARVLLTREVAEMLRTSESTVRYWRYVGEGPASIRVGRRVLYRQEAVLEWLSKLEREGLAREEPSRDCGTLSELAPPVGDLHQLTLTNARQRSIPCPTSTVALRWRWPWLPG